jgi:hypothetical protein
MFKQSLFGHKIFQVDYRLAKQENLANKSAKCITQQK